MGVFNVSCAAIQEAVQTAPNVVVGVSVVLARASTDEVFGVRNDLDIGGRGDGLQRADSGVHLGPVVCETPGCDVERQWLGQITGVGQAEPNPNARGSVFCVVGLVVWACAICVNSDERRLDPVRGEVTSDVARRGTACGLSSHRGGKGRGARARERGRGGVGDPAGVRDARESGNDRG